MDIKRIPREEIDKVKWNSCVHYALNGNIFGYMWYLDTVAKDWEALVEGDYQSVFPLVWRTNFLGRKELYQPYLMPQLGLYSVKALSRKRLQANLKAIPEEYRYVDIVLNEGNTPEVDQGFVVLEHENYQLMLHEPFEVLAQRFSTGVQQQLERAREEELRPAGGVKPETIAEFYREHARDRPGIDRKFHALQRVMYNVLHRGWGFASGVTDAQEKLLAVNFFIFSNGKVLSLAPAVSNRGKEMGALEFLTELTLRSNANRPLRLDFNTQGNNELAKGFGAQRNSYFQIRQDNRILGVW